MHPMYRHIPDGCRKSTSSQKCVLVIVTCLACFVRVRKFLWCLQKCSLWAMHLQESLTSWLGRETIPANRHTRMMQKLETGTAIHREQEYCDMRDIMCQGIAVILNISNQKKQSTLKKKKKHNQLQCSGLDLEVTLSDTLFEIFCLCTLFTFCQSVNIMKL